MNFEKAVSALADWLAQADARIGDGFLTPDDPPVGADLWPRMAEAILAPALPPRLKNCRPAYSVSESVTLRREAPNPAPD